MEPTRPPLNLTQVLLVSLTASGCVVVLGLFTNQLPHDLYIQKKDPSFFWDYAYYVDMAEHGVTNNPRLMAPFAYRWLTPWLAGLLKTHAGFTISGSFKTIAVIGALCQLVAVFLFLTRFGFQPREAMITMLAVALSMYHVKFLLFDPFRPDHLAYPLMLLAMGALLADRPWLCLLFACIGLQDREFLAVPPAVYLWLQLKAWHQGDSKREPLGKLFLFLAVLVLAILIPRLAIHVSGTDQDIDPIHNPSSLKNLFLFPLNLKRDLNLVFDILGYGLPLLILCSPAKLRETVSELGRFRRPVLVYSVLVFLLCTYGGGDLARFVTYFFIPSILLLATRLRSERRTGLILAMFVALVVFNRILLKLPIDDLSRYLDFYGGYEDRITAAVVKRYAELAFWIAAGAGLRRWFRFAGADQAEPPASAPEDQ